VGILIGAVVTASLLGSTHCVGMCGPLAMWASGLGDGVPRGSVLRLMTLYHLGRLMTYLIAGAIAGGLGSLVEIGGSALGVQLLAARIVGGAMIFIGVFKLLSFAGINPWHGGAASTGDLRPSLLTRMVAAARPTINRLALPVRATVAGLLTTLLPCGWLYLFALVAAGTGDIAAGATVMGAFWIGTVPALTALVAGSMMLSQKMIRAVPVIAAVLLIVAGGYTAAGRGFADLHSLSDIRHSVGPNAVGGWGDALEKNDELPPCCRGKADPSIHAQIRSLAETPLPCCADKPAASEADSK